MVWFSCSAPGCEAKAEHLVALRQTNAHGDVWLKSDELPEGWSNLTDIRPWPGVSWSHHDRDKKDDDTFCPEHAARPVVHDKS